MAEFKWRMCLSVDTEEPRWNQVKQVVHNLKFYFYFNKIPFYTQQEKEHCAQAAWRALDHLYKQWKTNIPLLLPSYILWQVQLEYYFLVTHQLLLTNEFMLNFPAGAREGVRWGIRIQILSMLQFKVVNHLSLAEKAKTLQFFSDSQMYVYNVK